MQIEPGWNRHDALKLLALDSEDLEIVSAHVQDAVFKVGDLAYAPRSAGSFRWCSTALSGKTAAGSGKALRAPPGGSGVQARYCPSAPPALIAGRRDDVLSLLAIVFEQNGEGPEGTVELMLSGDACDHARMWNVSRCSLRILAGHGKPVSSRAIPGA